MELQNCEIKNGENFTALYFGELQNLDRFTFKPSGLPELEGKVFLNQWLELTSCEISFNKLPAKKSIPFYHKHQRNEEIYIFLKGNGEFQVDDKIIPISEGVVIRVAPDGVRTFRNTSDEELYFIVIQARANTYEGNTIQDGIGIDKRVSWVNKERL